MDPRRDVDMAQGGTENPPDSLCLVKGAAVGLPFYLCVTSAPLEINRSAVN